MKKEVRTRETVYQFIQYSKEYTVKGVPYKLIATAQITALGKQEPYFSLTAELFENGKSVSGGCLHDEIAEHIPEWAQYIQWHLSTHGIPMHYIANTLHFAGDEDCWGKRRGDVDFSKHGLKFDFGNDVSHTMIFNDKSFIDWLFLFHEDDRITPREVRHDTKPTTYGSKWSVALEVDDTDWFNVEWYKCPFDLLIGANEFCNNWNHAVNGTVTVKSIEVPIRYSEGKPREFDAARRAANWPEATDEQLSLPKDELRELLQSRVPYLELTFEQAMTKLFGQPIYK